MHREALAPAGAAVARAELEADAEGLERIMGGVVGAARAVHQRDGALGQHQADVLLQPVAQARAVIGLGVALVRQVHPDLVAAQLDREDRRVVGELIEGAAGA